MNDFDSLISAGLSEMRDQVASIAVIAGRSVQVIAGDTLAYESLVSGGLQDFADLVIIVLKSDIPGIDVEQDDTITVDDVPYLVRGTHQDHADPTIVIALKGIEQ